MRTFGLLTLICFSTSCGPVPEERPSTGGGTSNSGGGTSGGGITAGGTAFGGGSIAAGGTAIGGGSIAAGGTAIGGGTAGGDIGGGSVVGGGASGGGGAMQLDAGLVDAGVVDAGQLDAGHPTRPQTDGGFTTQTTTYAPGGSHSIDLYLPSGQGPFPVILYIHGGAWLEGDRTEATPLARREAARGFVVASIDYRLSQTARWPAQMRDVKAAVRWLRANATQYRIDPARIAAWGASAGAHLAAVAGTSGGVASLEDLSMGNSSQSSRIQAVIDWYGPTDFLQMDAQTVSGCANANHNGSGSPESLLVGCTIQSCASTVATTAPQTYVDANDPPFLIMHGTRDCTVPTGQSRLLDTALRNAGVSSTLVEVPNLGHDFDGMRNSTTRMSQIETFLDRALYP